MHASNTLPSRYAMDSDGFRSPFPCPWSGQGHDPSQDSGPVDLMFSNSSSTRSAAVTSRSVLPRTSVERPRRRPVQGCSGGSVDRSTGSPRPARFAPRPVDLPDVLQPLLIGERRTLLGLLRLYPVPLTLRVPPSLRLRRLARRQIGFLLAYLPRHHRAALSRPPISLPLTAPAPHRFLLGSCFWAGGASCTPCREPSAAQSRLTVAPTS